MTQRALIGWLFSDDISIQFIKNMKINFNFNRNKTDILKLMFTQTY